LFSRKKAHANPRDNISRPFDEFLYLTFHIQGLTKPPEDYSDAKIQPHVQVALQMNQRIPVTFRAGDTVPYVICEGDSLLPFAQRARHPDDLLRTELKLNVGKC
jgi:DNA polymerase alpha subunit A